MSEGTRIPGLRVESVARGGGSPFWLDESIEDVLRAPDWSQRERAREDFLRQGPALLPTVIARLANPQPPEVWDLMLRFVDRWASLDSLLEAIQDRNLPARTRGAFAHVLALIAEREGSRASIAQIGSTLAALTKDTESSLRLAAVEAIGLVCAANSQARQVLANLALADPDPLVREEAESVLNEDR
jgi:hypothetical protein